MNEEAVKQLTKKGCMVGKEAAEIITDEDLERIEELPATPMYISDDMIGQIRERMSQKVVVSSQGGQVSEEIETDVETTEQVEKTASSSASETQQEKQVEEEPVEDENSDNQDNQEPVQIDESAVNNDREPEEEKEEQDIYSRKSSHFSSDKTVRLRDDRRRDELDTKVEVLDDYEIEKCDKDVPEFLGYYNDRYEKMKKLLMRRSELRSATSIKRLERRSEGDEAAVIGLVESKYSTNSGKYIVNLEDKTGSFKALVGEREGRKIVEDEMIGVS